MATSSTRPERTPFTGRTGGWPGARALPGPARGGVPPYPLEPPADSALGGGAGGGRDAGRHGTALSRLRRGARVYGQRGRAAVLVRRPQPAGARRRLHLVLLQVVSAGRGAPGL